MTILFAAPVRLVAIAHTGLAVLAFSLALFAGWASGLWQELCINSVASELAFHFRGLRAERRMADRVVALGIRYVGPY